MALLRMTQSWTGWKGAAFHASENDAAVQGIDHKLFFFNRPGGLDV
jgi:hypothetical protein